MKFADLIFEDAWPGATEEMRPTMERLRAVHPGAAKKIESAMVMERAFVRFPNGRGLSVVRNMSALRVSGAEFETCRWNGDEMVRGTIDTQYSEEQVELEMAAVASLPDLT